MKLLIICGSIAPAQAIASIRWTKIAKYLKLQHPEINITVLTNEKDFTNKPDSLWPTQKDDLLEKDMTYFDRYWVVPDSQKMIKHHKELIQLKRLWRAKTNGWPLSAAISVQPGRERAKASWSQILRSAKYNLFYLREYRSDAHYCNNFMNFLQDKPMDFDVVISSFGPAWTHRVAEQIKKQYPKTHWLADFRDPYAWESDTPFGFWLHRHFCQKHCVLADMVLRVNGVMQTSTPKTVPVEIITNGYDLDEALTPMRPLRFSLVFTGALYGNRRDMGPAFRALKELISEGKINGGQTAIEYAGNDSEIARECAKRYRMENLLIDHGEIPREQALELQRKAAILLQLAWNTKKDNCAWSGKMYEYMMMKKPIAFIVTGDEPNSYPSRHMALLGGCCYEQCREEETYPHLKQYILDKYIEWQQTGNVSIQRDENYVKQYSYREIAEQVWKLIGKEQ